MGNTIMTAESLMNEPMSGSFGVSRNEKGEITSPHAQSHYLRNLDWGNLTFDISNNKTLVNMAWNGSVKHVSFFRPTYYMELLPGNWTRCGHTKIDDICFSVAINGNDSVPCVAGEAFSTGYILSGIPVCDFHIGDLSMRVITYAPMDTDGNLPRCAVYALLLQNGSESARSGRVIMPDPTRLVSFRSEFDWTQYEHCISSNANVTMLDEVHMLNKVQRMDGVGWQFEREVSFSLETGQTAFFPCAVSAIGDEDALRELNRKSALEWLADTAETMYRIKEISILIGSGNDSKYSQIICILCALSAHNL